VVLNETSCGHSDCVALGVTLLGNSRYVCLCPVTFCGYSDCVALSETYVDTADMRGSGCNIVGNSDCVALSVICGHSRYVWLCPVTFCGHSKYVWL